MLFAGLLPVFAVNAFGSVVVTATLPGVTNTSASGPTLATSADFDMDGGNAVALLFTGENSSSSDLISAKFAGQPMILGESINQGSQWSGIFYLIAPAVTNGQFVITTTGTSSVCAYSAIALSGVDSVADSDADANTSTGGTISLSTTTAKDNGFVLGAAVNNGWDASNPAPSFVSGDADQTLLPSTLVGSSGHLHTYGDVPVAGTNTNVYGDTVQRNAYVTLAFEPVDAALDTTL